MRKERAYDEAVRAATGFLGIIQNEYYTDGRVVLLAPQPQ